MESIGVKVKLIEPGAVKTDFASRSLRFSNDETLSEYQPLIQSVFKARGNYHDAGISPEQVAEVIYSALNDNSMRLRYPVGPDSERILGARAEMNDKDFMNMVRELNGLSTR
jgi:short-subunit dehydrogenase